jgi:hypothetical protein
VAVLQEPESVRFSDLFFAAFCNKVVFLKSGLPHFRD